MHASQGHSRRPAEPAEPAELAKLLAQVAELKTQLEFVTSERDSLRRGRKEVLDALVLMNQQLAPAELPASVPVAMLPSIQPPAVLPVSQPQPMSAAPAPVIQSTTTPEHSPELVEHRWKEAA